MERRTALLAEDNWLIREFTRDTLEQAGFDVLCAADGDEALRLFEEHQDVALVVTDYSMPGLNGEELRRKLHDLRPSLPVILISGDDSLAWFTSPSAYSAVFHKPVDPDDLLLAAARAVRLPHAA